MESSMSGEEKIRVDLCKDHFRRLLDDDVCASCPSRHENEDVCKAMSSVLASEGSEGMRAVVTELQSIRRAQSVMNRRIDERSSALESELRDELAKVEERINARLEKMENSISGNGENTGLQTRLTVLETQYRTANSAFVTWMPVIAAIVASLLSVFGLIQNMGN